MTFDGASGSNLRTLLTSQPHRNRSLIMQPSRPSRRAGEAARPLWPQRRLGDCRLYQPEAWASDAARRRRVQVPDAIEFATKPRIACDLIAAALDARDDSVGPEPPTPIENVGPNCNCSAKVQEFARIH